MLVGWIVFMTIWFSAFNTGATGSSDWPSASRQYAMDMRAGNDYSVRERSVKSGAEHKLAEATRFLCDALEESCAEQTALEKRFSDLGRELAEVLGKDERLLPQSQQDLLAERRAMGERVLKEDLFCGLIVELIGKRVAAEHKKLIADTIAKTRDWRSHLRLMEAAGLQKNELAVPAIVAALSDKDARIRMGAADALAHVAHESCIEPLCRALADKEQPVRFAVISALSGIKQRQAVPHLIAALGKEEGLLRQNLAVLLEELTGQALGIGAEPWSQWWAKEGAAFLAGGTAPPASVSTKDEANPFSYYGIKTYSKKIIFVLDISDSMNDSAEETVVPKSGIPKRTGNIRPKILVARDTLTQALVDLPEPTLFNIVVYNKYVSTWKPKMLPASKRNKNDAIAFVMSLAAKESTNIMDALDAAFVFAGGSLRDKYYPSEVDTIFFLTDGKATDGRIKDTGQILAEVRRINRIGKVTLHTIGIGYLHDRSFLETMAKESGGSYVCVQ